MIVAFKTRPANLNSKALRILLKRTSAIVDPAVLTQNLEHCLNRKISTNGYFIDKKNEKQIWQLFEFSF